MPLHEIAAFGAAISWALASLISASPAKYLGAMRFNQVKLLSVTIVLSTYVTLLGSWSHLKEMGTISLIASGIVGIFVGDTILYTVLNRIGPRRTGVLFAMNAPIAALLGWLFLAEELAPSTAAGIALTTTGVVLAILYGKRPNQKHVWESVHGPLWFAVGLGLTAALAQAIGSILVRPAMQSGFDPVLGSFVRVGVSAACLGAITHNPFAGRQIYKPLTWKVLALTACSGGLSMAVGMTLLLYALAGGSVGVISTISATTPVVVLPMIWLLTKERPAWGAWAGALAVAGGMALIFIV